MLESALAFHPVAAAPESALTEAEEPILPEGGRFLGPGASVRPVFVPRAGNIRIAFRMLIEGRGRVLPPQPAPVELPPAPPEPEPVAGQVVVTLPALALSGIGATVLQEDTEEEELAFILGLLYLTDEYLPEP